MSAFWLWFSTGLEHITDFNGYDHILFVTLLCIGYTFKLWKKLLLMVTAFTIGHSLALALSTVGAVEVKQELIEFLIAFSILLTAVYHLINYKKEKAEPGVILYSIVLFFGLIHGLGFSYLLKAMLGEEESVFFPLLNFNLGLEAGQLVIVVMVLAITWLITQVLKLPVKIYNVLVASCIFLVAIKMCIERLL